MTLDEIEKCEHAIYDDWVTRIYYANIAMNNKAIQEVVNEISRFFHMSEHEYYEDKISAKMFHLKRKNTEGNPERPQARS